MNYSYFSKVYDEIMDDTLYEKWKNYTVNRISPKSSLLELACGSGHLGIMLKKAGYDITGLDLSNEMLVAAQENQADQNTFFPLVERDMKDLSELGSYDSVISFSDSICYLKDEGEMKQLFSEVYRVLNAGGIFLFDVHSILQIEQFIGYSYHNETDNAVFIWDSYEGEYIHSIEHDLSFFVQREDGLYERVDETHKERTYPLETYKQLLKEAGFQGIELTGDFKDTLDEKDARWFFKAVKRG